MHGRQHRASRTIYSALRTPLRRIAREPNSVAEYLDPTSSAKPAVSGNPACFFSPWRSPRSLAPRTPSPPPLAASASSRVLLHRTERLTPAAFSYSNTDDGAPAAAAAAPCPGPTTSQGIRRSRAPRAVCPRRTGTPAPRRRLRWCKHLRKARANRHCCQRTSRWERASTCTGC
ncbi:hypothetical protein DFH11DRAFT_513426 [Phellopilus nigrolimitatus]|nr:hypothetical protein DFH11DRAFT_513426 [Phellopilus nigrolimitatus]